MDAVRALSASQRAALRSWFPGARVVADHSWGLVDTTVLQLRHPGGEVIVKAAGPGNHHIGREIHAHEYWTGPLVGRGRAARLLHADRTLNMLATAYLPGQLVQGSPAETDPHCYRQAGALLACFHAQARRLDPDYEERMDASTLAALDREHRIDPAAERRLRAAIAAHPHPPALLVPTHGDWQPRNWLVHDGQVAVIDFGRAAWRPTETDLARLAARQFVAHPHLEEAFLDGYGTDPRTAASWTRTQLREAVSTAVWARLVGDEQFEAQGHRMIAGVLDRLGPLP